MALLRLVWDTVAAKPKAQTGAPHIDEKFVVGSGGQTTFTVTEDFGTTTGIDVFLNGKLVDEGGSDDYTRDAGANTITFNYTVKENGKVRVRVFP